MENDVSFSSIHRRLSKLFRVCHFLWYIIMKFSHSNTANGENISFKLKHWKHSTQSMSDIRQFFLIKFLNENCLALTRSERTRKEVSFHFQCVSKFPFDYFLRFGFIRMMNFTRVCKSTRTKTWMRQVIRTQVNHILVFCLTNESPKRKRVKE